VVIPIRGQKIDFFLFCNKILKHQTNIEKSKNQKIKKLKIIFAIIQN